MASIASALGLLSPMRWLGWLQARIQTRFQAWFQARLKFTDTLTLTQRNVYILPTRAGLMFALTLAVLLLASINYQLNLGYLLTFLLAGSGLAGMHVTHATLRGLTLRLKAAQNGAVGDACRLEVTLSHSGRRTRYGLGVAVWRAAHDVANDAPHAVDWVWADVPGRAASASADSEGSASVSLVFHPQQRGRVRVPTLTVETRYPLGLFRVWTIWRPAREVLVWPKPEHPAPPLPALPSAAAGELAQPQSVRPRVQPRGGDDSFDGVRAYRRGDPIKLVVWRKAAKAGDADLGGDGSAGLVSRDHERLQTQDLWLDEADCPQAQREARLSRLAAWVALAARADLTWGLRLPGNSLPPASGEAHRMACLEALALA